MTISSEKFPESELIDNASSIFNRSEVKESFVYSFDLPFLVIYIAFEGKGSVNLTVDNAIQLNDHETLQPDLSNITSGYTLRYVLFSCQDPDGAVKNISITAEVKSISLTSAGGYVYDCEKT